MICGKPNIVFLGFVLLFTVASFSYSYAQNNIEAGKQKVKALEEDIRFLDKQIELTQQQHKNTLNGLVLLQKKVSSRKTLLEELDGQIRIQTNGIGAMEQRIRVLGQRLDTLEFYYKRLIRNAYKNRDSRTWFMYILASSSIEQGYRRVNYLKNYSRSINRQTEKIKLARQELFSEKDSLSKLRTNNLLMQQMKEKEYQNFLKEEQKSKTYAKTLAGKQKEFKTQLAQKKREAEKLNQEVERMIAEAIRQEQIRQEKIRQEKLRQEKIRKEKEQQAATTVAENKVAPPVEQPSSVPVKEADPEPALQLSGDFASNKGKLPWPVSRGVIIESFGEHNHPTLPNVKLPFNNGVNISAEGNSAVKAVFSGIVKQIIAMPGYNQCILVQHGSFFTFYCKLDKVLVKVGDTLQAGEVLGNLEDDNNTAVLHFELWNGTTKQNPEFWLKKQ